MKTNAHKTPATAAKKGGPFFGKANGNGFFQPGGRFFSGAIQRKLTVGQPNDVYEKEADAVADRVVRKKPIFESEGEGPGGEILQKCAACEREEKVQKKGEGGSPSAPAPVESGVRASKGSGSPLPESTRTQMESSMGADFRGVRVHDSPSAAAMNKSLHAQAFTNGSDIYFNKGKYDPGSQSGQHLLAHELTHVVQQNPGLNMKREIYPHLAQVQTRLEGLQGSGPQLQTMLQMNGTDLNIQRVSLSDIPGVGGLLGSVVGPGVVDIADLFNVELPDNPIEAIEMLLDILHKPEVAMVVNVIPGMPMAIAALEMALRLYKLIQYVIDNKEKIIAEIKAYIEKLLDQAEPEVRSKLESALGFVDHRHFVAIWQAHLLPMLKHLKDNWWETIKETLWEQIWPFEGITSLTAKPEDRKGLGKDLGDLYDHFVKSWDQLKSGEFSKFIDEILLFEKALAGIANRFYGWVAIIIIASETLIGAGVAGFFSGGTLSLPGAAAGFGAGLATAGEIGEILFISTVAIDAAILIKSIVSLHDFDSALVDEQQLQENNEYYKQIASSGLSLTLAGILFVLSYLGGKIAEALLSKVVKYLPKSLQEVLENIKIGMKGGKPGGKDEPLEVEKNPPELNGEFAKLREAVKTPENIKTVTDPDLVADYDVEVRAGDHVYRRNKLSNGWCRFSEPVCGIKLDDINAAVDKTLGLDAPAGAIKPGELLTVPYKGGQARAEVISVDDQFVKIKVRSKSSSGDITQSIPKEKFDQMLKDGDIIHWTDIRVYYMRNRPPYRDGLVDEVWDNAKQPDGKVYDPGPERKELTWDRAKSRWDQWHMGHKPGEEYSALVDELANGKITEEQFLERYNDPKNYHPEDPAENMNHSREQREPKP